MPGEMNPSTYQQVRENMNRLEEFFGGGGGSGSLQDLIDRVSNLEEVINSITNPDAGSGDIIQNEDGSLTVLGVTIVTDFADTDTTPGSYTRDVTYELKNTTVVGLNSFSAFSGMNYAMVVTFKHNLATDESVDAFEYRPQQIAYGNNGVMYCRTATDATSSASWGGWVAVQPEVPEQQKQWMQSDTEPSNQTTGDYWCEPIE